MSEAGRRCKRRCRAALACAVIAVSAAGAVVPRVAAAGALPGISEPVDVTPAATDVARWEITPNDEWLVWEDEAPAGEVLWARPADGTGAPIRLSPEADHDLGDILRWTVTPDGSRIVFLADTGGDGTYAWQSAVIEAGSASAVLISDAALAAGSWKDEAVSADSSRLVIEVETAGGSSLSSVAVDGGDAAAPVNLHVTDGEIDDWTVAPDSSRVVFTSDDANPAGDVFDAYSVPIGGPESETVRLTTSFFSLDVEHPIVSPDSRWVFHELVQAGNRNAIFVAPIDDDVVSPVAGDGSACCIQLVGVTSPADGPDRVVYRVGLGASASGDDELWSAPVDDPADSIRLNVDSAHVQGIAEPEIDESGVLVYLSDEVSDGVYEMFAADVAVPGASHRISIPFGAGETIPSAGKVFLGGDDPTVGYKTELSSGQIVAELAPTRAGGVGRRIDVPAGLDAVQTSAWYLTPDQQTFVWPAADAAGNGSVWVSDLSSTDVHVPVELTADAQPAGFVNGLEVVEAAGGFNVFFSIDAAGAHVWRVSG